jgi:hypothetical protein
MSQLKTASTNETRDQHSVALRIVLVSLCSSHRARLATSSLCVRYSSPDLITWTANGIVLPMSVIQAVRDMTTWLSLTLALTRVGCHSHCLSLTLALTRTGHIVHFRNTEQLPGVNYC